jgi:hypothetical protein
MFYFDFSNMLSLLDQAKTSKDAKRPICAQHTLDDNHENALVGSQTHIPPTHARPGSVEQFQQSTRMRAQGIHTRLFSLFRGIPTLCLAEETRRLASLRRMRCIHPSHPHILYAAAMLACAHCWRSNKNPGQFDAEDKQPWGRF